MGAGIAFLTLRRTLRHGFDNLVTLALMGLIWYIGAVFILPIGPLTAGLQRAVKPMTEERSANWRVMLGELRRDLGWSSVLWLVLVIVLGLLLANLRFYGASPVPLLRYLIVTMLFLIVGWVGIMLIAFPVALRQDEISVRRTLRNSLIVVFSNPIGIVLSLVLLLVLGALFVALPPLFVLLPGLVALWGAEFVRLVLVRTGYLEPDEFADRP
ncbi:MAG: hypothetical protein NVS4B8_16510 [Herpetosiphon sp.]